MGATAHMFPHFNICGMISTEVVTARTKIDSRTGTGHRRQQYKVHLDDNFSEHMFIFRSIAGMRVGRPISTLVIL